MAPLGALGGAGGEEDLERGVGKDHRAHVATVGHQARRAPERQLQGMQRLAHGRQRRDARGAQADGLVAQRLGHVLVAEPDLAGLEAQWRAWRPMTQSRVRRVRRWRRAARCACGQRRRTVQRRPSRAGGSRVAAPCAPASVPLPDAVGPSMAITGTATGSACVTREQRFEVIGEGLGDAAGVFDPDMHRWRRACQPVEGGQRCAHGHAMVVVGAQAGSHASAPAA